MDPKYFDQKLAQSMNLVEIFEIVKEVVLKVYHKSRPGLMLGLADLGGGANQWIGGYHIIASNAIIMNSRPLKYVEDHHPELYKSYAFLILLHEYIHTLGVIDENETRQRTLEAVQKTFGQHLITELAFDIGKFLPYFQQVQYGWRPSEDPSIYYLMGFDRSSTASYYI